MIPIITTYNKVGLYTETKPALTLFTCCLYLTHSYKKTIRTVQNRIVSTINILIKEKILYKWRLVLNLTSHLYLIYNYLLRVSNSSLRMSSNSFLRFNLINSNKASSVSLLLMIVLALSTSAKELCNSPK